MNTSPQPPIERYIAIDAHKHYVVIGGLNVQMETVLPRAWRTGKQTRRWSPSSRSLLLCLIARAEESVDSYRPIFAKRKREEDSAA